MDEPPNGGALLVLSALAPGRVYYLCESVKKDANRVWRSGRFSFEEARKSVAVCCCNEE